MIVIAVNGRKLSRSNDFCRFQREKEKEKERKERRMKEGGEKEQERKERIARGLLIALRFLSSIVFEKG